ncbi:hypothetical protein AB8879_10690 [Alphaproteobacteria bacterium LSUCC0744]
MSKGEITPKTEISKLLGAKPVLPGENADEYAAGLAALIAELDAKTVLKIYLAEKIYDCLWWIGRYEAQKRMVMIAQMAEIVQDHYLAKSTIDAVELREALISEAVTAEMYRALQDMGHTIESLKQQALSRKSREIRALDEQIALQAKNLAGFQTSYEVAANRKLNIERMKLQNEMLRRDVEAIDIKPLDKKS